mmetsp:Transcript_9526/g.21482  ORF Transcript_9526/g.21482 Transcript_9526/m.21482 type:complete len:519 (-) Transcript_9526:80-1636(-)|eukprot:CAMPEP_0172306138 /NCGR_PEP_ID=MMETSP1058-20130122/7267_1 /TAXON_ID=83371 /ORGANISM="Detonula confervacea, Strain CCMP 353" /LENGTH=518 /DNA_ID=CAMNT_0013017931 /DNA_START=964 /DNA_END=2520 /DNA_ORIENTATION=-
MIRPPLYSRTGNTSPTAGTDTKSMAIGPSSAPTGNGPGGAAGEVNSSSDRSLLDKAQTFSMFAVQHVEEVRQALISTADTKALIVGDGNGNSFGRKNSTDITAAFGELTAAYEKLSSLKWDVARMEFEDMHRVQAGMVNKYSNAPVGSKAEGKIEKRIKMVTVADSEDAIMESRGVKDHPWQGQDDDMNPHDWISDAFLKAMSSEEDDEGGDSFPINGNLASLNATAEPYPNTSTPPGFKSESTDLKADLNDAEEQQADGSVHTKPTMQSLTSIASEISSLHTSQPYSDDDDDDQDTESDYSDSSSSSEELPPMENFDYVYKGGYAMQVSGGKETKGVVPKTVKRVLIDPSVKSIEEGAFQGCNVLESVTIPSSVEAVGDNAFRKCSKLKKVTFLTKGPKSHRRKLWNQKRDEKKEEKQSYRRSASAPSSITEPRSSRLRYIGEWAFFNCSSLAAVKLPYGLESIGTRAFQRCSSMSVTELPKTLTSVGENAFVGCPRETKAAYECWEKEQSNKKFHM